MPDPVSPPPLPDAPPAPRPSKPPAAQHPAVLVADRIADMGGVAGVVIITLHGRISGELAVIAICALLGALQGLRQFGGAKLNVGGAASLLVALGSVAWVARAALVGTLVAVIALLTGCPALPPPDGCTPAATRCAPDGVPEVCSQTARWTREPTALPCARYLPGPAVCCATSSARNRPIHACVPQERCAP